MAERAPPPNLSHAASTAAPPHPPSLGMSGSSPTWAQDSQHTWGGPSVLLTAGWDGGSIDIGGVAPQAPAVERDVASRFDQLLLLGKGGMGEVWRVRDVDLNRVVAMKIVRATEGVTGALFARFVAEAQATAQLEHPGIVPVYELGRLADGRIYYTMQEIKGRNLAAVLTDLHANSTPSSFDAPASGWTFNRVIEAFRQVADTISFAHARGVIHRDLKPANIMLGAFGEVRVVDWGLVKVLDRTGQSTSERDPAHRSPLSLSSGDSSNPATSAGAVAGTRGYMAPEQAAGQIDLLSPATDVYALGGILYAILAGKAPGDTSAALNALDELPRVPAALREICARAMAPSPADRYADASHMAAAISTWLERSAEAEQLRAQIERFETMFLESSEPVQAELRETLLRIHGREGRPVPRPADELKGPALDALSAAGVVKIQNNFVLITNPDMLRRWERLAGWLDAERDSQSLRQGLHDQAESWERHGRTRGHLWKGEQLAELDAWMRQRNPRLSPVERSFALASQTDERQLRHRRKLGTAAIIGLLTAGLLFALYQERQAREALTAAEAARASETQALRLAEGRALGAEAALATTQGKPHTALALGLAAVARLPEDAHVASRVTNLSAGMDPLQLFAGHQGFVYHNEWVGTDRLISSGVDRTLRLWDARTGATQRVMHTAAAAVTIAASPDGTRAAAILENGVFELWDLESGERIASETAHEGFGLWTEFSSDGRLILTSGTEARVRIWDGHTGAAVREIQTNEISAGEVNFARASTRFVAGPSHPSVYDAETGALLFEVPEGYGQAFAAIASDGSWMVTATAEGDLSLWDVATGARRWSVKPRGAMMAPTLLVSVDDSRITVGYGDGDLRSFRADSGEMAARAMSSLGPISRLDQSRDGPFLLSISTEGRLGLWDASTLQHLSDFRDPAGEIAIARPSTDGSTVLIASREGAVKAWKPRIVSARDAGRCAGQRGNFTVDSANGGWLAFATEEGACVRPAEADRPLVALMDVEGSVVALSALGDRAAFADGRQIAIVDTATGADLWRVELEQPVIAAAFSHEEGALLVQLEDQHMRFLDAATGATLSDTSRSEQRFRLSALQDLAATPLVALNRMDGALDIYDAETGTLRRTLPIGMANIYNPYSSRALPDGARIAVGDNLGHLRVFELGQDEAQLDLEISEAQIVGVATQHTGSLVAALDGDGALTVVDVAQKRVVLQGQPGDIIGNRLSFSPDDKLLVSSGQGGALTVLDASTGEPVWRWKAPGGTLTAGCVLDSGQILSWTEGTMNVWDMTRSEPGALTNNRVCEGTTRVVAVTPFPAADASWAPAEACAEETAE